MELGEFKSFLGNPERWRSGCINLSGWLFKVNKSM